MIADRPRPTRGPNVPDRHATPRRRGVAAPLIASALLLASCRAAAPPCPDETDTRLTIGVVDYEAPAAGRSRMLPPSMLTDVPLLVADDRGRTRPGLAIAWEASADRRTWTLTIPDRLVMHSGQRLTTEQLKARLLHNRTTTLFDPVSRDIVAIDTPTPVTLVFRLARPSAALPESLRQINPGSVVSDVGLGTGPYRLVSRTEDHLDFEAFADFIGGAPRLAAVRTRSYTSPLAAWAAFQRQEVDMLYEAPPTLVSQLAQQPDVALYASASRQHLVLGFQQRSPRLRDVRVRRALNMAIDRGELARRAYGTATPASRGPFSPSYWAAEGLAPTWRYDLASARADLAAARGPQAGPPELECLTTSQYPVVAALTAALESQLARVNVRLKLVPLSRDELLRRLGAGEFETFVMPVTTGATQLWPYIFWHSGSPPPSPRTHYAAADAALEAAYGALDDVAERAAVRQVQNIMRDDPPAAFLVTSPVIRAIRRRWRLPPRDPDMSEIRRTIPQWRLADAECRP